MIAKRLKSDDKYLDVIMGLIKQLQDAEQEVINLRNERDHAIALLEKTTSEFDRIVRLM